MKFFLTLAVICLVAATVAAVPKAGSDLTYITRTLGKTFYKGANADTYESASNNCEDLGGRLAEIRSAEEKKAVAKALQGQAATRLWVGAMPRADCGETTQFEPSCWVWESDGTDVDVSVIAWNKRVTSSAHKPQKLLSRAYFELTTQKLNFDDNTVPYPFVCEIDNV